MWEHKLTQLIRNDPAFEAISYESAAELRAWFRFPAYKVLYKVRTHTDAY